MFEDWSPTALLVHGAALTYVIGFLVRDQLVLRGLLQVGSILYILYYYLEPETPLWDAIAWTAVMFAANAWTISRILSDRREGTFSEEDLVLYGAISHIGPGDFRRLMTIAERSNSAEPYEMTVEGKHPNYLYFIPNGQVTVAKKGQLPRVVSGPMFIGEIAYLLNGNASATTHLRENDRVIRWPAGRLRELAVKHDGIRAALESAFNRDLAAKVAAS